MAQKRAIESFKIYAILDGTTINAALINVGDYPLRQGFKKGTDVCIPNFNDQSKNPCLVAEVRESMTGTIRANVQLTAWTYNGVTLSFDSDGLCTTGNYAGLLKKTTKTRNGVACQALQIMGNLATVSVSSHDNDVIGFKGTVEINGFTQDIELYDTVEIFEITSSGLFVYMKPERNYFTTDTVDTPILVEAVLFNEGIEITDKSERLKYYYKFYDDSASTTVFTQADNQPLYGCQIKADDVDDTLILRCDVFADSAMTDKKCSGTIEIHDYTDPYNLYFVITDSSSTSVGASPSLHPGDSVKVTPKVEVRATNEDVTSKFSFVWRIYNNTGGDITESLFEYTTDAKNNKVQTEKKSLDISYDTVKSAGYGLSGYVVATLNTSSAT